MMLGSDNVLKLDGKLDDGRCIRCEGLFATEMRFGTEDSGSILFANHAVELGVRMDNYPDHVSYPLVGHFDGDGTFEYEGWVISITHDDRETTAEAKRTSQSWLSPMEGMTLVLMHQQATLEEYTRRAHQIATLLSLADGNGVTCHRQILSWQDKSELEILREWTGDELGPGACVAPFDIMAFLVQCLPAWDKWPESKRQIASLAIGYINSSAHGYLDNRLLGIAQAWEILATAWTPEPEQTQAEKYLLTLVKSIYRHWKKISLGADPDGVLMDRLSKGLRWPPILQRMLVLAQGINGDRIGLHLKDMKRVRDCVAHTGSIPPEMHAHGTLAIGMLTAARFGLQLILLRELNYTGRLRTGAPDGGTAFPPIKDFVAAEGLAG